MGDMLHYDQPPFLEEKHFKHFNPFQITQMNLAFIFAFFGHLNQTRLDGSPYINHPLRMTRIAMEVCGVYDTELTITLMTHDMKEEIKLPFISETVHLWFGLKNRNNMNQLTKTEENKKTFLKDIVNSGDWRLMLSKLIDRTDNMQTLSGMTKEFQQKQAKETRESFLPMCDELAKVIPEEYKDVPKRLHGILLSLCEQYGC